MNLPAKKQVREQANDEQVAGYVHDWQNAVKTCPHGTKAE